MNGSKLSLDALKVLHLMGDQGLLCRVLKGFQPRKQQQLMTRNVVDAYNSEAVSLIEAGTGTGKSLAYLLPAILWALENHQRTLISTHTIALQQQLIEKDIPMITKALNLDIKAVLVKGMSNYLCKRKFHEMQEGLLLFPSEERAEFERIEAWAETTNEGSKSSLPMVPSSTTWEQLCAESDTCAHAKCPHYQECFFFKARRKAEDAQILVANHHLLFADLEVRAETENYKNPAILPTYSRIIIDEAHHVEDIATEFFGEQVSKLGLLRILGRIASERQQKAQGRLVLIKEKLDKFYSNGALKLATDYFSRMNIDLPNLRQQLQQHIIEAFQHIDHFVEQSTASARELEESVHEEMKLRFKSLHHEHPIWCERIMPAAKNLIGSIEAYVVCLEGLEAELEKIDIEAFQEQTKTPRQDIKAFIERLQEQVEILKTLILEPPKSKKVRWIEVSQGRTTSNTLMRDADLDVSTAMAELLFSQFSTVVLCSATLTTNRQFEFIRRRLGITEEKLKGRKIEENIYDSPFDYKKQALFCVPTDLPSPNDSTFIDKAVEQIWQAIEVSRGGVFVLFTSYTMMQACHEKLAERLKMHRYNVFKQGDIERQALLASYKVAPRSVLFGTDSFWEGIDVAGDALRCVIIVKLPFRVPTQPVIQARTEAIKAQGGDAFTEYSLPAAIVKFKQGFGRLIRNVKDRGCIVCLDTRLVNKRYGQLFINSLPECQQCFASGEQLGEQMKEFYRKTHYLTRQN